MCEFPLEAPSDGKLAELGTPIDRRRLRAMGVEPVLSEAPVVIEGHAFTTGVVPRTSIERVLPNTVVEYGVRDGVGCDPAAYASHHFTAEELSGKAMPDQHWHEHAADPGPCRNAPGRPSGGGVRP